LVTNLILEFLDPDQLKFIKGKMSRNGTFQSLSCRVIANSREQIDCVFERLSSHPDILMVI
jgi:putative lipoic acid-binding regulatory protein